MVFSVEGFADGSERRALKKLAKPLLKKSHSGFQGFQLRGPPGY